MQNGGKKKLDPKRDSDNGIAIRHSIEIYLVFMRYIRGSLSK